LTTRAKQHPATCGTRPTRGALHNTYDDAGRGAHGFLATPVSDLTAGKHACDEPTADMRPAARRSHIITRLRQRALRQVATASSRRQLTPRG
jgi:hypothetical protein